MNKSSRVVLCMFEKETLAFGGVKVKRASGDDCILNGLSFHHKVVICTFSEGKG